MAPTTHGKKIEKSRGLARRRGAPPRVRPVPCPRAPETRISGSVPAQCCEDVPLCTGPLRDLIGSTAGRGLCPTSRPAVADKRFSCTHTRPEAAVEEPAGSNGSKPQEATLSAWPARLMVRWIQSRRDSTGLKRSTLVVLLVNLHERPRHRGNGSGPGRPFSERIWPACQLYHRRMTLS